MIHVSHLLVVMQKPEFSYPLVVFMQVLGLLWNLAHSEDVPTDIMDLALSAHIKILDYSCSQVTQWMQWRYIQLNYTCL